RMVAATGSLCVRAGGRGARDYVASRATSGSCRRARLFNPMDTDSPVPLAESQVPIESRRAAMICSTSCLGCLLPVFIDIDRQPPAIATVYRTSKLAKYERGTA